MGAAIRFIRSAPVPSLQSTGSKPIIAHSTVIAFGRMRRAAPSTMASSSARPLVGAPAAAWESFKYRSITTPVSASSPANAMIPTHTATLRW